MSKAEKYAGSWWLRRKGSKLSSIAADANLERQAVMQCGKNRLRLTLWEFLQNR
ncbi:hypothetical protein [Collimonas fungivorans]|uniref:hypothetical protein n=1 Tax=Collimonas fungivorans TaxID=158899 RepID=UPI003FA3A38A